MESFLQCVNRACSDITKDNASCTEHQGTHGIVMTGRRLGFVDYIVFVGHPDAAKPSSVNKEVLRRQVDLESHRPVGIARIAGLSEERLEPLARMEKLVSHCWLCEWHQIVEQARWLHMNSGPDETVGF